MAGRMNFGLTGGHEIKSCSVVRQSSDLVASCKAKGLIDLLRLELLEELARLRVRRISLEQPLENG
jgi:hypothetical protein